MRFIVCSAAFIATIVMTSNLWAVNLLTDAFDSGTSASNYTEVSANQTQLAYGFDYSTMGIPSAPHTPDSSTLGLKMEANMSFGVQSAVTLHTVQQFSGAYNIRFDAWINANGPFVNGVPTSTGSTEFLTAGVGGDGVTVNGSTTSTSAQTGSGGWTAVDGDSDAARDFRLHKIGTEQTLASGQYAAGTTAGSQDNANAYYSQFTAIDIGALPVQGANNGGPTQQTGSTPVGCVGFAWHQVELRVNPSDGTGGAASVSWYIDGLRIGTLDAGASGAFSTNGSVTIGYWDAFTSISDNASLSFGLIDNLVVLNADFNGDTKVDAADYVLWRKNSGLMSGATNSMGDANGDGMVDQTDYDSWRAAFDQSTSGSGAALSAGAVPEPTSCAAAIFSVFLGLMPRRSR